jgi:ribosomal protein L11 methylase PrmA
MLEQQPPIGKITLLLSCFLLDISTCFLIQYPFISYSSISKSNFDLRSKVLLGKDDDDDGGTLGRRGRGRRRPISDWVTENLENSTSQITSSSFQAGENDTLPLEGLCVAGLRIMATATATASASASASSKQSLTVMDHDNNTTIIRLLMSRNGWGTGIHPTTHLCLTWLSNAIIGGEVVLDYGCGSGILSLAALTFGASHCLVVDVEAEALVTTERNMILNGWGEEKDGRFEAYHTREIIPYQFHANVAVANILIGQLVRPSMVAALVTNIVPGGLLCLSGIRPFEVESLKKAYDEFIEEWVDYEEMDATDIEGSIDSYGFDVGRWSRLVGRLKLNQDPKRTIDYMSELAVS